MEHWKDVVGFEGIYAVSDLGRIKRLAGSPRCKEDRLIKLRVNERGYMTFAPTKPGVRQSQRVVHRIVLESFVGIDPERPFANHKNGIKTDNSLTNLEWVTASENIKHAYNTGLHPGSPGSKHGSSKLTERDVENILNDLSNRHYAKDIASKYSVSLKTISQITAGLTWKHIKRPSLSNKRTGRHKLTTDEVVEIKRRLKIGESQSEIARSFNVSSCAIWQIADGRTWSHV